MLFRGLRLKAGVDMGRLRGEINCITGRMSYRGRGAEGGRASGTGSGKGLLRESATLGGDALGRAADEEVTSG